MIVLITQGDHIGIGPEVTVKALKAIQPDLRKNIIVVGSREVFLKVGWDSNLVSLFPVEITGISDPEKKSAVLSFKSLNTAVKLIKKGLADAVVTSPVSKKNWLNSGINFNGHTDYFRKLFKRDLLMAFKKEKIIAGLLCEHVPLKKVSDYVKKENIIKKTILLKSLLSRFKINNAKIGIASLNPHCGEEGSIGDEEIKEILPALKYLRSRKINITGIFNPDDIVRLTVDGKINGSLFMYHDQLIPLLKVMDLKNNTTVHITWGLDFPRTSPAHGTARDIAGKNKADPSSMIEAIKTAFKLI